MVGKITVILTITMVVGGACVLSFAGVGREPLSPLSRSEMTLMYGATPCCNGGENGRCATAICDDVSCYPGWPTGTWRYKDGDDSTYYVCSVDDQWNGGECTCFLDDDVDCRDVWFGCAENCPQASCAGSTKEGHPKMCNEWN